MNQNSWNFKENVIISIINFIYSWDVYNLGL